MSSISSSSNRKRSKLNLSHSIKLTGDMGVLYPVLVQDVYPGDTFSIKSDCLVRFAPMLAPVLHKVDVYLHTYFVPFRILEDKYEQFVTGGEKGDDTTIPAYIVSDPVTGFVKGGLPDYFGLPLGVPNLEIDAKYFRAYFMIHNEFYRQQDLQDPTEFSLESGLDTITPLNLSHRNWNKDYFTSALPFQQKGPAVALPLTGDAPIKGLGLTADAYSGVLHDAENIRETGGSFGSYPYSVNNSLYTSSAGMKGNTFSMEVDGEGSQTAHPKVYADLSQIGSATVNDLRKAFALQRILERNMRCGARYTEFIQATWGVHNKDYRLQRPEFLGGGKSHAVFTEILQTSSTDATSPLGTMAGHGFSSMRGAGKIVKSITEYGVVITLLSVMPKSSYNSQGIEKKFSIKTRFDLPIPDMAHIGEDAILNKELFAKGSAEDNEVWGYVPKFQSLRHNFDKVVGEFRDDLDFWTLVRNFDTLPSLNAGFLRCVPSKRIFAETLAEHKLRIQVYHKIHAIRPIPKYGIPGFIDH